MTVKRSSHIYRAYKITNLANGKSYIGITGETVHLRWGRHKRAALNEGRTKMAVAAAIRSHGPERFSVTEIAQAYSRREAVVLEQALIAEHGTYWSAGGYNLTFGGDGFGAVLSVERRVQIKGRTAERWKPGGDLRRMTTAERSAIATAAYLRDPTIAERIAAAKRGKTLSDEHVAAFLSERKSRWQDPAYRERLLPIVLANVARSGGRPKGSQHTEAEKRKRTISCRLALRKKIEAALGVKIEGDPATHCARGHPLIDNQGTCETCRRHRRQRNGRR